MSREIIHAYLDRRLCGAELISADDHIASCEECRARAGELAGNLTAIPFATAGVPAHLSFEQLDRYVRRQADDVEREIAELHLSDCATCRDEVEALQAVDTELSITTAPAAAPSFTDRIGELLSPRSLRFAIPAFLLIAAAGVVYWLINGRADVRGPDIAVEQPPTVNAPGHEAPTPSQPDEANAAVEQAAAATLKDNNAELRIDADGKIIGVFAGDYDKRIAAAIRTGTVSAADEAGRLRSSTGVLMGPGAAGDLHVRSPVGKVIASDRPEFRWTSIPAAASYRVEVFDTNYTKVAESPAISEIRWRPSTSLPRGREYTWQVTAVKDGETIRAPERPAPDARFIVLSAAKLAEVERAKRSYPRSNLVLGLVYAEAGLLDDAEAQFSQLAAKNPDSQVARKLLASIRSKK